MSENSIDHLVKMANQIASGVPVASPEDKIASTASHLCRFWTPLMRKQISEFVASGGQGLNPIASQAVGRLSAGK